MARHIIDNLYDHECICRPLIIPSKYGTLPCGKRAFWEPREPRDLIAP